MTVILTIIVFSFALIAWTAGIITGASFILFYITFPFACFHGWINFDYSRPFGMNFITAKMLFKDSTHWYISPNFDASNCTRGNEASSIYKKQIEHLLNT